MRASSLLLSLLLAFCGFAETFVNRVEGLLGELQTSGADVGAEDDGTVLTMIDSIAGFQHGAFDWHGGVV